MVHLDYRDARPIYAQIMDDFKEQISSGVLLPGERLPSVRELAGSSPCRARAAVCAVTSGWRKRKRNGCWRNLTQLQRDCWPSVSVRIP